MTIKELEQQLEIPRATIRFYEKEKLINPKRNDNSYREYSEEDIATLKKIIILRKIGLSVSDIKKALDKECTLQVLLEQNISALETQIKVLGGAISISRIMQSKNEDIYSLNENIYWEEINKLEQSGLKFKDILNDVIEFERNVILKEFSLVDKDGKRLYGLKGSILAILGTLCIYGLTYYVLEIIVEGQHSFKVFLEGFFMPFVIIMIASVFGLPLYFIRRKNPQLAITIKKVGIFSAILMIAGLIILALR